LQVARQCRAQKAHLRSAFSPECPLWVVSGHFADAEVMSALPPKADIHRRVEPLMNKEAVAAFSTCEFGSASVVGELIVE
jgi:hypothetical protein